MQTVSRSPEEIEYAFTTFVEKIQVMIDEHFIKNYTNLSAPTIAVYPGRKYWRIVKEDPPDQFGQQASVYGFVRKADGAIFKAASWKAPNVKGFSAIRGYVNDSSNGMNATTPYGIVYAGCERRK